MRKPALLLLLLLASCGSTTEPLLVPRDVASYPTDKNIAHVALLYATDRGYSGDTSPANRFGGSRDRLRFGWCDVSVPREHRMGRMESPSLWRFEFAKNPEQHWIVLTTRPVTEGQFGWMINSRLDALTTNSRVILVFVHGFRVPFDEAVRRTAQIAYDLGFAGVPIAYSWPSAGKVAGYASDYDSAVWSAPHLATLLTSLARHNAEIAVIAHSMGNVVLTRALELISRTPDAQQLKTHLREVILAAPDVDADVMRQLTVALRETAGRVTLYASNNDEALRVSRELRGGLSRAGDATPLFLADGIETVDASAVDTGLVGHSYYGDNRSVLSDIFNVLRAHAPPGGRFGLLPVAQPLPHWVLLPGKD